MKQNAILAGLLVLVAAYFVVTWEMRPAPQAAMGGMGAMPATPPPDNLDTARHRTSDAGAFEVAIAPEDAAFARNQIHNWVVTVTRPDASPVEGAEITVDGGMPQHNHGLPTAPKVTRYLGDGRYLIEGVRFNMPGWWELKLTIQAGDTSDTVTFNLVF